MFTTLCFSGVELPLVYYACCFFKDTNYFTLCLLSPPTHRCSPATQFPQAQGKEIEAIRGFDVLLMNMACITFTTTQNRSHYFSKACYCSLVQRACNKYNERLLGLLYLCHLKQFHE